MMAPKSKSSLITCWEKGRLMVDTIAGLKNRWKKILTGGRKYYMLNDFAVNV